MKVPKPVKLPSGNYFIQLRLGGRSVSITKHTAQECRDEAAFIKAKYRKEAAKNVPLPATKDEITLRAAIDRYLSERKLSPSTVRGYRIIQKNQFPEIMDKRICKITEKDLRLAVKSALDKYAVKTVKNGYGLISSVLKANNVSVAEINYPADASEARPYLNDKQVIVFLNALRGSKYELPALFALMSLRRSEIAALDWDKGSVEIRENGIIIHVKGAVVPDEHNKFVEKKENKTDDSRRNMRVEIPRLAEMLRSCPNKHGKVVGSSINKWYKGINDICEANGLPRAGVHGLRHSFAALARKSGLTKKAIKELGGWSDYRVVDKIYDRFDNDERMEAENKLGEWFKENAAQ